MSRIIVKNLPPGADEGEIREFFKPKGEITDVKLMRKKDGSSRRFAFVGFKTNEDASSSASFFNNAFMKTSKLQVEVAKELNDSSLVSSRDRKKRKREAAEAEYKALKKKTKNYDEPAKDDKLEEFMDAMKPQSATAMWKNDLKPDSIVDDEAPAVQDDADEEDMVDLTSRKSADVFVKGNRNNLGDNEAAEDQDEDTDAELEKMRQDNPEDTSDSIGDQSNNEAKDENISDLDWMLKRRTLIRDNGDGERDDKEPAKKRENIEEKHEIPAETTSQIPVEPTESEKVLASGRLFMRNLSYSTTEEELRELLESYGNVRVHVPTDPKTDKSKGIAFASFDVPEQAVGAYESLDGTTFQGRLLHIIAAKPAQKYELDEFDLKNMPLKKQQLLKKKMNAAKQQFSWNSLYLNRDAVLETVAAKLGVTKSEMMDPHSSNMAVKAALAESTVLESVQSYFKSKGVDLAKLDTKDTTDKIILVKNIPFGTSLEELSDLFGAHGELVRILMPPDGGIAIVQYMTAPAGRAAFSKLAFRRLGNSILYLQKGPVGLLEDSNVSEVETKEKQQASSAKDIISISEPSEGITSAVHTSVFVKNLNFDTTTKDLSELFKSSPGFLTATIKTKPHPKNPGKTQSMGYGFVEFATIENAETAIAALNGHKLDGHDLQLKISTRGKEAPVQKASTSKIVIKNVPFETTRKDIYDLFGTFGQLRSVRLPRKFNKQTRGFAFAEFATVKEAETAMTSLTGAHLLGRRLIMQFAEAEAEDAEEEIARMEKKVQSQLDAEQFAAGRVTGQSKGFDMDEPEE